MLIESLPRGLDVDEAKARIGTIERRCIGGIASAAERESSRTAMAHEFQRGTAREAQERGQSRPAAGVVVDVDVNELLALLAKRRTSRSRCSATAHTTSQSCWQPWSVPAAIAD